MSDWVKDAKERCEAATPGPWVAGDYNWSTHDVMEEAHMKHLARVYMAPGEANTRFIAAARTDLPHALACVEAADRLVEALDALRESPSNAKYEAAESALAAYRTARGSTQEGR